MEITCRLCSSPGGTNYLQHLESTFGKSNIPIRNQKAHGQGCANYGANYGAPYGANFSILRPCRTMSTVRLRLTVIGTTLPMAHEFKIRV
jgi:hypothetical protein